MNSKYMGNLLAMPAEPVQSTPAKKKKGAEAITVKALYDFLAVDGNGHWRKETPYPEIRRPLEITFPDPEEAASVATAIRTALATEYEPVRRPCMPNPESDFTELQWFSQRSNYIEKFGPPTKLKPLLNRMAFRHVLRYLEAQRSRHLFPHAHMELSVNTLGLVTYKCTGDQIGFFINGNNTERVVRMLKQFGVNEGTQLLVQGGWRSPVYAPIA
jgi:hypothetical protein